MSWSNKWSFVEASAPSSANKSNIKNQYFFGVSICFCSNLLCSRLVSLSASPTERDQKCSEKTSSLPPSRSLLFLARGECKLNSFLHVWGALADHTLPAFASRSLIVRQSLELLWRRGSRGGYHRAKPRRGIVEFDVAARGNEPQTGAEEEMWSRILRLLCHVFKRTLWNANNNHRYFN